MIKKEIEPCKHCGYDRNWHTTHWIKCPNHPCQKAIYPSCNGANGCDTCEHGEAELESKIKEVICQVCGCPEKEELDDESCWCGVSVNIKGLESKIKEGENG